MISLETARELLDFRGRSGAVSPETAEDQLRGAVAVHNLLVGERVAYLADEVGMGKTYVALGALALLRHFRPNFRVLVIAPRENIQHKWVKELRNFTRSNLRYSDLRMRSLQGSPARAPVICENLLDLVRECSIDPDRDFFLRLTSFSLPLGKDADGWRKRRDALREHLPWADEGLFDLRSKSAFKDNLARAICCTLPRFDLVIVDEGHNLKHGLGGTTSDRNRVLASCFGHADRDGGSQRAFPGYGSRVARALFLSATPIENDFRQLWNQLDLFGLGDVAQELRDDRIDADRKREIARRFLIRRVTAIRAGGESLTKNLYRREWRAGGIREHDIELETPAEERDLQRLIVALVQKKVSELLGHERFNNSFQIGMLASFESFLQTAKVAGPDPAGEERSEAVFDDSAQSDDELEREGLDVGAINQLAASFRRQFARELPHPKMDALVAHLGAGLESGRKALVFVRRVASVKELQAKLEERYDQVLFARLRRELPEHVAELERQFAAYGEDRKARRARAFAHIEANVAEDPDARPDAVETGANEDEGGLDSFFAWFFRGEGPPERFSGAALQRRMTQAGSAYATFFEDNAVARLLRRPPGQLLDTLSERLGVGRSELSAELRSRAGELLPAERRELRFRRLELFVAYQRAALEQLADDAELGPAVRATLANYPPESPHSSRQSPAAGPERWLEEPTFFSALLERTALRDILWVEPSRSLDPLEAARDLELRRQLLSATARLGNAFIDLWILAARARGTLRIGTREDDADPRALLVSYLDLLERQRDDSSATFTAFRELELVARHHALLLDVNFPELRGLPPHEATAPIGRFLGRQRPIGGMFGSVNRTMVRQFRMPGYPFVMISTDLLQEGEDLHTFCSEVYHYGISWMPSSMEQRVGRIDRVNSQTERRLSGLERTPDGEQKLQVYYPHLTDTVEVLQVRRVLERLNRFIRLMHENLEPPDERDRKVQIDREVLRTTWDIVPIREPLTSAFPVRDEHLDAPTRPLRVSPELAASWRSRFEALADPARRWPGFEVLWETNTPDSGLRGTAQLASGRVQPFLLLLRSLGEHVLVRCVSPIASVAQDQDLEHFADRARRAPVNVAEVRDDRRKLLHLSAEAEVLLVAERDDHARVSWLVRRVVEGADELERALDEDLDLGAEDAGEILSLEVDDGR